MSFGIALAGGGVRGAAHAGVLLALEEGGLRPSSIAGTSAGGIMAGLYACGVSAQKLCAIVRDMAVHGAKLADLDEKGILAAAPTLLLRRPCAFSGLLKGNKMENWLEKATGSLRMRDLQMRTVIPAVNLYTGHTVAFTNTLFGVKPVANTKWVTQGKVCEAMRATSALPVAFQPKRLNGMCLVDGGIADVLPVDLLAAAGEPNILAVDVSENYTVPKSVDAMAVAAHSLCIMETRLRECVTRGEKYLLNPELPKTEGVLNLPQMVKCMEAGYTSTKKALPQLRKIFRA